MHQEGNTTVHMNNKQQEMFTEEYPWWCTLKNLNPTNARSERTKIIRTHSGQYIYRKWRQAPVEALIVHCMDQLIANHS